MGLAGLRRKKNHSHGQWLGRIQRNAGLSQQKLARNARGNTDAIARLAVGSNGSPMLKARQRGKGLGQNVV